MMRAPASERIGYFGKLPACADFVKVVHDAPAMEVLDDWLARTMSALPADARWKINYDALAPVSFAFVGPARRQALAGHIVASRDRSGRRFPFLLMRSLDVAEPAAFVSRCALACAPLWSFAETAVGALLAASDPGPGLQGVADAVLPLGDGSAALDAFLAAATVGELGTLLGHIDAGRLVLALGLLLQPVMHSKPGELHKSLVLPLPDAAGARHGVAAFWLELIAPFLRRAGFDLALFLTHQQGRPVLVVGFCASAAATLRAIIDPRAGAEHQVSFADTGWIDEQLTIDLDVRKLASYLGQPQLRLEMARELFLQTFIGAAP